MPHSQTDRSSMWPTAGQPGIQSCRRSKTEGGAEFSFLHQHPHSHSEHRVCTVLSRQQIRSHHTPHHSVTRRLISFLSSPTPPCIPFVFTFSSFVISLPFCAFLFVPPSLQQKDTAFVFLPSLVYFLSPNPL